MNRFALFATCLALPLSAFAGSKAKDDALDALWRWPVLWHHPEAALVQEVRLTGVYHVTSSSRGDDDGWATRRLRYGVRVAF